MCIYVHRSICGWCFKCHVFTYRAIYHLQTKMSPTHAHKQKQRRVEDLERMGRLTGVVDDRGKFIHVERGEMEKVCMYTMP